MQRDSWKIQYRTIYDILYEIPRVPLVNIERVIGKTAKRRLKEALALLYIIGPELRKLSYRNLKEYVYLLQCEDSDASYLKYRKDQNVIYHAQTGGFCDLFLVSKDKMNIDEDIIVEGYRSDYHVSFAPNHSWETALEKMRKKIKTFNPRAFLRKNIIKTHFDETIKWDYQDEIIYRHFKYDLRNSLQLLQKEHEITGWKIYEFLDRLPETCTVFTSYYPDTLQAYDSYLFMFETNYEDFIIDFFSQLPTTSSFFSVGNKLFVSAYVSKPYIRSTDPLLDGSELDIPSLLVELLKKEIVKSKAHAILERHKGKDL